MFKSIAPWEFLVFIFVSTILSFPNSFSELKLILVAACVTSLFFKAIHLRMNLLGIDLIIFFLANISIVLLWLTVGLVKGGAFIVGVYDYLKIYVLYGLISVVFLSYIQNKKSYSVLVAGFIFSFILICSINTASFVELIYGGNFFSDNLREELSIGANQHEAYFDVTANNINTLFFLIPILFTELVSCNGQSRFYKTVLVLLLIWGLFVSLVSGRRALILLLVFMPIMCSVFKFYFSRETSEKRIGSFRWSFFFYIALILLVFIGILLGSIELSGVSERILASFDSSSDRAIQLEFLSQSFYESPLYGHGLATGVSLIRSLDRPWMYELTYNYLLHSMGLFGIFSISALYLFYTFKALFNLKKFGTNSFRISGFLLGFIFFSIAAASNPYYSSFDTIFFLGIPALISGWNVYLAEYE